MPVALFHVNAFTAKRFGGNPAAVCLLNGWLDDDRLRAVAAENNLFETAFFVPRDGHYELRWFSPRCVGTDVRPRDAAAGFVMLKVLEPEHNSVPFELVTAARRG